MPKSVAGGLAQARIDSCCSMYPGLRAALAPLGREHLVPETFRHFVTDYDEKWPEMFVHDGVSVVADGDGHSSSSAAVPKL